MELFESELSDEVFEEKRVTRRHNRAQTVGLGPTSQDSMFFD